jgi:hypothetical protein
MLFKQAILAKVRTGEWTKPPVKAGGLLNTSVGRLAINEVRPVAEAQITEAAARPAGGASRAGGAGQGKGRAAPNFFPPRGRRGPADRASRDRLPTLRAAT